MLYFLFCSSLFFLSSIPAHFKVPHKLDTFQCQHIKDYQYFSDCSILNVFYAKDAKNPLASRSRITFGDPHIFHLFHTGRLITQALLYQSQ